MHLRSLSLSLVLSFLAFGARAQTFDTIVFDGLIAVQAGDTAPGTGGGTFVSFSSVSLSPSGAIAFVGSATGGTVSHGLFLHDGGVTTALVLAGDSAPGTSGVFTAFRSVDLNDANEIAFEALATGTFWAAGNGEGVFRQSALGVVSKVVLGEELAPDTGGASYVRLGLGEVAIGDGGHVAFRADLSSGANGLFREPPGGPVSSVALQGQAAPGTGGATYSILDRLAVDGSGDVAFSASYGASTLSNGIFLDSGGTDSVVSRQGDFVANTGAFYGPATCGSVSQAVLGSDVDLNDAGLVAFRASASLNTGLFSDSAGTDSQLVAAAEGAPTGGMGGAFACFQSGTHLALNELGDVAFWAAVNGSSVAEGVFVHSGGTTSSVALEGDLVPGGGGPVYLAFSSASVQIDDTARVAFGAFTNTPSGGADDDADGIPNVLDKCSLDSRNSAAPATCDSDTDGYGNVCDSDFDQNFITNSNDFSMFFVPAFKGLDPAPWPQGMDLDCNGTVGATDFGMYFVPKFKGLAPGGASPGPSGLSCAGTVPCPAP